MRRAPLVLLLAAVCLPTRAQYGAGAPATGKILVASEKLQDPNFTQSVILLVASDPDGGTLGVVVNRRSDVPLSKIFPTIKGASNDPVYMGGPVEIGTGQGLLRSEARAGSRRIMNDVYATGSKDVIENSVAAKLDSGKFRLYLGYAGWAPGQLQSEIQAGAWTVRDGNANIVFDQDPDSLWVRLNRLAHSQIAAARETTSATSPRMPVR
ncbi:MAG: YqgE/AlgH family protein [Acidobacteriaceae bacterium]|nr:YqgE/AlgH family protein [Acidobacteriaceae bacterium]MBV8570243.1 YqgE/AlgH family protein [Acidobacteriaceae bacterium]